MPWTRIGQALSFFLALRFSSAHGTSQCDSNKEIVLGVDYYPEQWPLEDMRADMHSIKNELGADLIRVGEFMWHVIEPTDGAFNFTLLDSIVDAASAVGLRVMLGTPTATMPAWLYTAHGDAVLTRGPDSPAGYSGVVPGFGGRRQYSFNSETYLMYAGRIVTELAKRFGSRIDFWQIDNELGHEGSDLDFSTSSLAAWRRWLRETYLEDIHKLNSDWGTAFWSVTFNSFDEVPLPKWTIPGASARPNENFRSNSNPGMLLDFRRFRRDSITDFADRQVEVLRAWNVTGCITTNAPGGTWGKTMDSNHVFAKMDFVSYDNYPVWGGSLAPTAPSQVAMDLDIVRGWGPKHGQGFTVAEQLIGAQGHDIIGYTPRPNQIVAWSAQTLLHGATAVSFFRWRAAVFGQEEFCYGVLDQTTERGTGRKWKEAQALYALARSHQNLWLQPVAARVVVLYDTENNFMWQGQPQSTAFSFEGEAHRLYYPFWRQGAAIDVLASERALRLWPTADALLNQYRVILLPSPMYISDELAPVLEEFVVKGGALWIGFRSDLKDSRSQIRRTGSRLAALAGVEIAEIESLNIPTSYTVTSASGRSESTVSVWREGLQLTSGGNASALWKYSDDFFGALGYAAVTQRLLSQGGEVIYLGAGIEPSALIYAAGETLQAQGVRHAGMGANDKVEQILREDSEGVTWRVAINYNDVASRASDGTALAPYAVSLMPTAAGSHDSLV